MNIAIGIIAAASAVNIALMVALVAMTVRKSRAASVIERAAGNPSDADYVEQATRPIFLWLRTRETYMGAPNFLALKMHAGTGETLHVVLVKQGKRCPMDDRFADPAFTVTYGPVDGSTGGAK